VVDTLSLHLQAAGGDPRAQFQLARMKLIGRDVPYAPDEAMRLVKAACAQKYPQALLFHAALAARGLGRTQNFDDAIALVAEAAATGDARSQGQLAALGGLKGFNAASWFAPTEAKQHCEAPRIYTVENFLPKPACVWLAKQGAKGQKAAPIKDPGRGGSVVDGARSNTAAGFSSIESDLVLQLTCLRIAAAIGVPIGQQEPTNILHYERGQEYRPHFDFITESEEHGFGRELQLLGQRIATVLIYLNDGYQGGETAFPRVDFCFKGKAGDALIFWNLAADGQRERDSLHAGLPVTKGEKWILSKWVREKPHPLI
jgi:hypothetical protein